jgi:hypothetical protein
MIICYVCKCIRKLEDCHYTKTGKLIKMCDSCRNNFCEFNLSNRRKRYITEYNQQYRQQKKGFKDIFINIMNKTFKTTSWLKHNVFELNDTQLQFVDKCLNLMIMNEGDLPQLNT